MIYRGEDWDYFKVVIPAGDFNITGERLAEVCQNYGLITPCPSRVSCYKQKLCQETSHTTSYCTSNMIGLQTAIANKGYPTLDADHLAYTFVTKSHTKTDKDGGCGYWPSYYCHKGETTISNGNYFALCATAGGISSDLYRILPCDIENGFC